MEDYRERFLEAEMQAVDLVTQLEKLKQETSHYNTAAGSLSEARESIVSLIQEQSQLALGITEVVDTLGEIGTAKIIEEINSNQKLLTHKIDSSVKEILESNSAIQERIDAHEISINEKADEFVKQLEDLSEKFEMFQDVQKLIRILVFVIGGLVVLFGLASSIQLFLLR